MSDVSSQMKSDAAFIGVAAKNIPTSLFAQDAKLIGSEGAIKTKEALKVLDRYVSALAADTTKPLSPEKVEEIHFLQEYLTALIGARGGSIPTKLSSGGLIQRQTQLDAIKNTFSRVLQGRNMEPVFSSDVRFSSGKMSLKFKSSSGDDIEISKQESGQINVNTKEKDSFTVSSRINQVKSDESRKGGNFVRFTSEVPGTTSLEKIGNLIATMDEGSQDALIKELYDNLPESAKKANLLDSLCSYYKVSEDAPDLKVAILAQKTYLSCSATSLLTSHQQLQMTALPKLDIEDTDTLVPTITLARDATGIARPKIEVQTSDQIPVKTPPPGAKSIAKLNPKRDYVDTHRGQLRAVCDPIAGTIEGSFTMVPRERS